MIRRRSALAVASVLTAVLTASVAGCADSDKASGQPSSETSSDPSLEQITPEGVAALVDEHLGADNVKAYGTYEAEEGSVGVMVRLRGADRRDMFMVDVMSPEGVDGAPSGAAAKITCERLERRAGGRHTSRTWCQDLPGGGTAAVDIVPYGFSDDNAHGRVLSGMGIGPDRFANALYDSYTRSFPLDPEDLLDLMADERLSWMTDPRVNDAGRAVEVRRLEG